MTRLAIASLAFGALLAGGCLRVPKASVQPSVWVLTPVEATANDGSASRTLAVGPVLLPDYLRRKEVVRREGPNQLVVEEFDHWGDSFDAQVSQVLVQNLEALVPGTRAMAFPWRVPGQPDLQLVVDVPRFDADAAGAVSLDARWELVDPAGRKRVAFGNSRIRKQAEGPEAAAVVAAMSDALGDFSREVARVIQESGR